MQKDTCLEHSAKSLLIHNKNSEEQGQISPLLSPAHLLPKVFTPVFTPPLASFLSFSFLSQSLHTLLSMSHSISRLASLPSHLVNSMCTKIIPSNALALLLRLKELSASQSGQQIETCSFPKAKKLFWLSIWERRMTLWFDPMLFLDEGGNMLLCVCKLG